MRSQPSSLRTARFWNQPKTLAFKGVQMQPQDIDLSIQLLPNLKLDTPLWIASCHHTAKESSLKAWARIAPAALTLKTSKRTEVVEEKQLVRYQLLPLQRYGRSLYCDGPKHLELLTYKVT